MDVALRVLTLIAPFAHHDLKWSLDVPHVVSINTSDHKFGLVYAAWGGYRGTRATFTLSQFSSFVSVTFHFAESYSHKILYILDSLGDGRYSFSLVVLSARKNYRFLVPVTPLEISQSPPGLTSHRCLNFSTLRMTVQDSMRGTPDAFARP